MNTNTINNTEHECFLCGHIFLTEDGANNCSHEWADLSEEEKLIRIENTFGDQEHE